MTNDKREESGLDAFFAAGRNAPVEPSNALLGRIMADADAQMPSDQSVTVSRSSQSGFVAIWAAIGGWPAAAGMATAALVGVWIGFSQPAGLDLLAESVLGDETDIYLVDLVPAFGDDLWEG